MEKTKKKYTRTWFMKLISLFIIVFIVVLFISYSSVIEVAAKNSTKSVAACNVGLLDPFTLDVSPALEPHSIVIESEVILTERHQVRAPYKPPWPPPQKK
jgi:flagellar basal body-associated protein FliL